MSQAALWRPRGLQRADHDGQLAFPLVRRTWSGLPPDRSDRMTPPAVSGAFGAARFDRRKSAHALEGWRTRYGRPCALYTDKNDFCDFPSGANRFLEIRFRTSCEQRLTVPPVHSSDAHRRPVRTYRLEQILSVRGSRKA